MPGRRSGRSGRDEGPDVAGAYQFLSVSFSSHCDVAHILDSKSMRLRRGKGGDRLTYANWLRAEIRWPRAHGSGLTIARITPGFRLTGSAKP